MTANLLINKASDLFNPKLINIGVIIATIIGLNYP